MGVENVTGSENGIGFSMTNTSGTDNNTRSENGTHIGENIFPSQYQLPSSIQNISNRFAKRAAANEIFFLILAASKFPDDFSRQAFSVYFDLFNQKGKEYANGLLYSLLLAAKENPSAYFVKAVRNGAEPNNKNIKIAKNIITASESVFLKIGVDILPKDFSVIAELLNISSVVALLTCPWVALAECHNLLC
jgi:hypothetical protein